MLKHNVFGETMDKLNPSISYSDNKKEGTGMLNHNVRTAVQESVGMICQIFKLRRIGGTK
ncbi:hypothetical protein BBB02_02715 [Wolbachia endosymbiont of Bemisia tabaci]|jgi:hypothetical protein|nr:hypothetical protein BBB02_02715 [Wolbachia endosymbiont of Bemisia tabaci]